MKYSNFNLLQVEDTEDSEDVQSKDIKPQNKSQKKKKSENKPAKQEVKAIDSNITKEPQLDSQPVQQPQELQQPQQSLQKTPPPSNDHTGGSKAKKQAIVTRTIWTFIMVFGFFGCLMAGHAWLIMLVMLCQSLSYREVTALFGFKTEYGLKAENSERDRWSTILNWWVCTDIYHYIDSHRYFFIVTNYFLYGESIIYYLKVCYSLFRWYKLTPPQHIIFADVYFIQLAKHHRFISFMLYVIGFMGFVANLKRSFLKRQFVLFCWVHMSLLLIVLSSHFIVNNILEGIIWFWVPASLVICNDIFAYVFGMAFGKTPLIALSPKKTVEGFVGGGIATVIFAWGWGTLFQQWKYMICPVHDLGTSIFSNVDCVPNPAFIWRDFEIPSVISGLLSSLVSICN